MTTSYPERADLAGLPQLHLRVYKTEWEEETCQHKVLEMIITSLSSDIRLQNIVIGVHIPKSWEGKVLTAGPQQHTASPGAFVQLSNPQLSGYVAALLEAVRYDTSNSYHFVLSAPRFSSSCDDGNVGEVLNMECLESTLCMASKCYGLSFQQACENTLPAIVSVSGIVGYPFKYIIDEQLSSSDKLVELLNTEGHTLLADWLDAEQMTTKKPEHLLCSQCHVIAMAMMVDENIYTEKEIIKLHNQAQEIYLQRRAKKILHMQRYKRGCR